MKMTRSIRFKSKTMIASLSALAALVVGAPAFAADGHFTAQLCGTNVPVSGTTTAVKEIYQGIWTRTDGSTIDAFLVRYFDGGFETYLTTAKVWDKVLGMLFYDVYETESTSTPPFLSFGIDGNNTIVGDTVQGDGFSAKLHPTQSATNCAETPPSS